MEELAKELIGTTIDQDRVALKSIIGTGSFATVFLGIDLNTNQQYAVKTLFKTSLSSRQIKHLRKEYVLMKRVCLHQNITTLHKVIETPSHMFLFLEKCSLDLYDAIISRNGFPSPVVKEVFVQLIDALMYCHSKGVYHRDIKPENVLISADFTVKFTDFGLSTTDSWSTEFGCGSLRYMSPECMGPVKNPTMNIIGYSPAADDIWSMGVILVNLLTGKNPWHEATLKDPIYSAFTTKNPNVLKKQFNLSQECNHLLLKTFETDPTKRITLAEMKRIVITMPSFFDTTAPKYTTKPTKIQTCTKPIPSNIKTTALQNFTPYPSPPQEVLSSGTLASPTKSYSPMFKLSKKSQQEQSPSPSLESPQTDGCITPIVTSYFDYSPRNTTPEKKKEWKAKNLVKGAVSAVNKWINGSEEEFRQTCLF